MDFQTARRAMVDNQLRPQAVTDPLVIAAMAVVPREEFVPEEGRANAYIDRIVPLGGGRFLNPPATLGRLLTELEPRPAERALVLGSAPEYAAAVLRHMGLQVEVAKDGDLTQGSPDGAPYDLIVIDGAVEYLPDAIVNQLRDGGRLGACLIERGVQRMVIGQRAGDGFGIKSIADAAAALVPGFEKPKAFSF